MTTLMVDSVHSPRATRKSLRPTGYSGIAIYHPKTEANVGTLWRSSMNFDVKLLATIGRRYKRQSSDTCKAPLSLPLHHYRDLDDLIEHLPHGCPLIGVELHERAVPLTGFRHPPQAMYLLGAEDHGLPDSVIARCHALVQIPTPTPWSLNVACAGSIVLADRYRKALR